MLTAAALTALPVPARIQAAWAESGLKGGQKKEEEKKKKQKRFSYLSFY